MLKDVSSGLSPKNAIIEEKAADEACCSFCKHLHCDLEHQRRKSLLVSPAKRANRQAVTQSNFCLQIVQGNEKPMYVISWEYATYILCRYMD